MMLSGWIAPGNPPGDVTTIVSPTCSTVVGCLGEPVTVDDAIDHGFACSTGWDRSSLGLGDAGATMDDTVRGSDRLVDVVNLFDEGPVAWRPVRGSPPGTSRRM